MVSRPAILIADEPTGNLDAGYASDIMHIFQAFNQVGVTVIIATHDARSMSMGKGQVLELHHGELKQAVLAGAST